MNKPQIGKKKTVSDKGLGYIIFSFYQSAIKTHNQIEIHAVYLNTYFTKDMLKSTQCL